MLHDSVMSWSEMDSSNMMSSSSPLPHSSSPGGSFHTPHAPFIMRANSSIINNHPLDEGYSEDTRSQSDSGMAYVVGDDTPTTADILHVLLGQSEERRVDIIMDIIRSLSNHQKEKIGKHIFAATHFDPAAFLPTELFLQIMAYLEPEDVRSASSVSRSWRERAFDERLWQLSFAREGWQVDADAVQAVEKQAAKYGQQRLATSMLADSDMVRKESRKRRRTEAFNERDGSGAEGSGRHGSGSSDAQQGSVAEEPVADTHADADAEEMEGLETSGGVPIEQPPVEDDLSFTASDLQHSDSNSSQHIVRIRSTLDFKTFPNIFQHPRPNTAPKLSWMWLYKQRRRLEWNWENKKFKPFTLPHPDHLIEGHTECVYTIQHTARHLVSGSRDRTIRIWDLETNRLKGLPLTGHEASVLCLQFDERKEHDIIVSGGSDSSIIIWKFSTGEMVKHIRDAHSESVLNLRFDDRYIVTCSKDKTIKVWSRKDLTRDSPLIPTAVLSTFVNPVSSTPGGIGPLIPAFTPLLTIKGHAAAVNAVQIHQDTIVSASGDRTVKAWDLNTGKCVKNYTGHAKGIACVQFDGRRVVSGSSDNTVRLFDAEQAAEVACLTGHKYLVRTVQARFGDMRTTTTEELREQAETADRDFRRAVAQGLQPGGSSRRSQMRSAGSSRPEDMISLGAHVPPGGGGTRWARIVSGSYDESVIVWKKESDGNWAPKYSLNQADIIRTGRRRHAPQGAAALQTPTAHLVQLVAAQAAAPTAAVMPGTNGVAAGQQGASTAHNPQLAAMNASLQQAHTPHNTNTTVQTIVHAPMLPPHPPYLPPGHLPNNGPNAPPAAAAAAAGAPNAAQQPPARETYRLFKLQFDARRIVCCSQNRTIVGYDFANGDKELEKVGDWCAETA